MAYEEHLEKSASRFHEAYEKRAPDFECSIQEKSLNENARTNAC